MTTVCGLNVSKFSNPLMLINFLGNYLQILRDQFFVKTKRSSLLWNGPCYFQCEGYLCKVQQLWKGNIIFSLLDDMFDLGKLTIGDELSHSGKCIHCWNHNYCTKYIWPMCAAMFLQTFLVNLNWLSIMRHLFDIANIVPMILLFLMCNH